MFIKLEFQGPVKVSESDIVIYLVSTIVVLKCTAFLNYDQFVKYNNFQVLLNKTGVHHKKIFHERVEKEYYLLCTVILTLAYFDYLFVRY